MSKLKSKVAIASGAFGRTIALSLATSEAKIRAPGGPNIMRCGHITADNFAEAIIHAAIDESYGLDNIVRAGDRFDQRIPGSQSTFQKPSVSLT